MISNSMWIKRFGKDPGVIGQRIYLDRESYDIVGVMPAGFYPVSGGYPELWTPHWAHQKEKGRPSHMGLGDGWAAQTGNYLGAGSD